MSKLFTLITDSGKDHFVVGRLKGLLLRSCPDAKIVDITHEVDHFNMVEAAHQLQTCYADFPDGTIHMVHVNSFYAEKSIWIAFEKERQFFIGPNNGLFSLVFEGESFPVFEIGDTNITDDWPGRVMAVAAAEIAKTNSLSKFPECPTFTEKIKLHPVVREKTIRGTVIYIDEYGNVITNITKELYEKVRQGRQFALYFKRFDPITYVSQHYAEEGVGDTLCRFNSIGYLEIAIHLDRATDLLDLRLNDTVQIEFY
ncbi:MAG: hypothetical protein GVX96_02280 [Bacteroidetes bacterium]|jgi:S-adenosylmethionine hydrolase|nr:hypothetical protein [Bacteroidota bacterium]